MTDIRDPFATAVRRYLRTAQPTACTLADLLRHACALPPTAQARRHQLAAAQVLRALGWRTSHRTTAFGRVRVWTAP